MWIYIKQILPMLVLLGIGFFFTYSNKKNRKKFLSTIKVGERVSTQMGIVGKVLKKNDKTAIIKSENIQIEVLLTNIIEVL